MMRSALLFYPKLKKDLEDYDFEINEADPCVANKMVNGTQMTVTWHVNGLKVSHKDEFQLTLFACYLRGRYGDKMTVNWGKIHDYLGMDLDYTEDGVFGVYMIKYLHKIFNDFHEELGKSASSPAADYLFKVKDPEEADFFTEELAKHFHHSVAQ
jgi:hypothetical protein